MPLPARVFTIRRADCAGKTCGPEIKADAGKVNDNAERLCAGKTCGLEIKADVGRRCQDDSGRTASKVTVTASACRRPAVAPARVSAVP